MHSFLFFSLFSLFSCFLTAHSLAVEQRSSCITPDVVAISQQVSDPHYFCTWFLSDGRTRSPVPKINANALLTACKCITSAEPAGTKAKTLAAIAKAARLQSFVSTTCVPANPIRTQFKDPSSFCTFFNSFERHDSPVPNLNVPAVKQACKCVLTASKSSTKTSSTTSKVSSKPSSTKISTKVSATKSASGKLSSSKSSSGRISSSKSSIARTSSITVPTKSSSSKISTKSASPSSTSSLTSKSSTVKVATSKSSSSRILSSRSSTKLISSTIKSSSSASITTSSHPLSGAGLGFTISRKTSLDGLALSYYKQMTSDITYNSQGTIMGHLKQATLTSSVPAVTADPMDRSAQPSLQSQLQAVGLPSFDATVSDVTAAMESSLMSNVSTNGTTGVFGDPNDSDLDPASNQTSLALARHRLAKRYSFDDFLDNLDTAFCNDFVTSLFEVAEAICGVKDAVEALICLFNGCYNQPPPPVQYVFNQTYNFDLPSFRGGYVYKDDTSTLVCNDCGMSVSNMKIRGTIVVDVQSGKLLYSAMQLSQDTTQRFNMGISTTGPASGSWSYVMSTRPLNSFSASGVFTISPQVLYAIGATWSTSQSSSLTFGARSTLNGASVLFDPVEGAMHDSSNWIPSLDITQPKLTGSSATLIPWIQSSVQISLNIYGQNMPNAVTITSQTSLGFTQSLVTMAKLNHAQCGGGQLQSTSYQNVVNSINFPKSGTTPLYSSSGRSSPVCQDAQAAPPSSAQVLALGAIPGAGKFCSSFIRYVPSTVSVTVITTITQATSTVSVVGSGTTTITPSLQTSTATITSSVSSITQNFKRTVTTTKDSFEIERRALIARRVIPTPTILSTWLPQQVSAACSSFATGVIQSSVTTTQTISSGITTATIQGTVTAGTPMTTTTSIVYAPAVAPYNAVSNPTIGYDPNTSSPWTFSGAANNYYFYRYFPGSGPIRPMTYSYVRGQILGTGSISQVLSGLEPGWTYNFNLRAGFDSTTDTCTVTYSLDGVVFESYSPSNTGEMSNAIDYSVHPKMKADGPYQVVPTATTQTLTIAMSCLGDGGFAEFDGVKFQGPYAE